MARASFHTASRQQRDQRIATVGNVVLFIVVVTLSVWMYHKSSTGQAVSPHRVTPPKPVALHAWLGGSEQSISGLVTARNHIAAAAAQRDLAGTGAACRTATSAVADLHRQMPSPEPVVTSTLQDAMTSYAIGLPYCISASQAQDGAGMQRAATYISLGDQAMRAALDILEPESGVEPRDLGVLIV